MADFDTTTLSALDNPDLSAYASGGSYSGDVSTGEPIQVPQDTSLGDMQAQALAGSPTTNPNFNTGVKGQDLSGYAQEPSFWDKINTPAVKGNAYSSPLVQALGGLARITPQGREAVSGMFQNANDVSKLQMQQEAHKQNMQTQGLANIKTLIETGLISTGLGQRAGSHLLEHTFGMTDPKDQAAFFKQEKDVQLAQVDAVTTMIQKGELPADPDKRAQLFRDPQMRAHIITEVGKNARAELERKQTEAIAQGAQNLRTGNKPPVTQEPSLIPGEGQQPPTPSPQAGQPAPQGTVPSTNSQVPGTVVSPGTPQVPPVPPGTVVPPGVNQGITHRTAMVEGQKLGFTPQQQNAFYGVLAQESQMGTTMLGDGGNAHGPGHVHQPALDDVNKAFGTHYTLEDLHNPEIGTRVSAQYFALKLKENGGDPVAARLAYNGGGDKNYIANTDQRMREMGVQPGTVVTPGQATGGTEPLATASATERTAYKGLSTAIETLQGKREQAQAEAEYYSKFPGQRYEAMARNAASIATNYQSDITRLSGERDKILERISQREQQGRGNALTVAEAERKEALTRQQAGEAEAGKTAETPANTDLVQRYEYARQQAVRLGIPDAEKIPALKPGVTKQAELEKWQQTNPGINPLEKAPEKDTNELEGRVNVAKTLDRGTKYIGEVTTGHVTEPVRLALEKLGIKDATDKEASLRAILNSAMADYKKAMSGTAVSAAENTFLETVIPTPKDSMPELIAKYNEMVTHNAESHKTRTETMHYSNVLIPDNLRKLPDVKVPTIQEAKARQGQTTTPPVPTRTKGTDILGGKTQ